MKSLEIKATVRTSLGKKATKNLRNEGNVPCVMYGGEENVHFSAPAGDFRHLIYTPHVYTVTLDIDGKIYNTILQDIQFHPVTDEILHIDFLQIFEDKKVSIEIPVSTHGFARGVKEGGKLQLAKRKLKVFALPKDLPDVFDISIDDIGLGDSIKIKDLNFENIELLDPKSNVVLSVRLTRIARGMAAGEDGAEPEAEAPTEEEANEE